MKYSLNDKIYFNEKEYGKILEIKKNEQFCFEEITFKNYFTNKIDSCYNSDLRYDNNNRIIFYPQGV